MKSSLEIPKGFFRCKCNFPYVMNTIAFNKTFETPIMFVFSALDELK